MATSIDILTGGWPCQDISIAGSGAGIHGGRSGLWGELVRALSALRPEYAIFENSTNLLAGDDGRWFATVLRDLASVGYDAEWHCISASHFGAPHIRDRVWILAYPNGRRWRPIIARGNDANWPDAGRAETNRLSGEVSQQHSERNLGVAVSPNADGRCKHLSSDDLCSGRETAFDGHKPGSFADAYSPWGPQQKRSILEFGGWTRDRAQEQWSQTWPEKLSEISRMDDGTSRPVDKLGCNATGNCLLPQIPEAIGRAILMANQEIF